MSVETALDRSGPGRARRGAEAEEPWSGLGPPPAAVLEPGSVAEVAEVLRWASAEGIAVVPAGTGRHLPPGLPGREYVALSARRLTGLEVYEPADVTFTAWAGTRVGEISERLGAHDQWLPFDPPDLAGRTLGGLVASGADGPLATGFGGLRNHVLGVTLVSGDGRVLRLGGRVVKNVAGFDVLKAVVGSGGRLGVVVSACMRAFPMPAADIGLVLDGEEPERLVDLGVRVGTAPVLPASCVVRVGAGGGSAELLVRLTGAPETVEADRRTLEEHLGRTFDERARRAVAVGGRGSGAELPPVGEAERPAAARKGGASGGAVVVASLRPSRLREVLAALSTLEPSSVEIDTYAARLRTTLTHADPGAVAAWARLVERYGGAVRVEQEADPGSLAGVASELRAAEAELARRVAEGFDPEGVLWATR